MGEHQVCRLTWLIEPDGGLTLFKVAYKPQAQTGAEGKATTHATYF